VGARAVNDTAAARLPSRLDRATLPALISAAERALAEASNFEEVRAIRDQASALRAFAEKMGVDTRRLSEIKLRAEIRLGEELAKREKAKGQLRRGNAVLPREATPTLAELGISKVQASRWQQAAAIPAQAREDYFRTATEVTTLGLLRFGLQEFKAARRAEREEQLAERTRAASLTLGTELFGVIYLDPPLRFEVFSRETGMTMTSPDNYYPTMTFEELHALKLPAAKNSAIFQWATMPTLDKAQALMAGWGFTYKSAQIWIKVCEVTYKSGLICIKPKLGTGYWYRNEVELLLLGTKGDVPAPAPGEGGYLRLDHQRRHARPVPEPRRCDARLDAGAEAQRARAAAA
jgi:N6-adenosine-specific RNA methylase IME4